MSKHERADSPFTRASTRPTGGASWRPTGPGSRGSEAGTDKARGRGCHDCLPVRGDCDPPSPPFERGEKKALCPPLLPPFRRGGWGGNQPTRSSDVYPNRGRVLNAVGHLG